MDENNTTEQTAIQAAIKYFTDSAPMNCGVMYEPYMAVVNWLQELAGFKDSTPITDGWLWDNGFSESGWVKVGDNLIRCYETGRARWFASVSNDERNFYEEFGRLKTIGQLKMFLALCGIFDNQLKDFVK